VLDRRDVHDDAGALCEHRRQQCAIEADGGHQIQIHLLRPHLDDGRADALGADGHERTSTGQFEIEADGAISSRAILSPSRVKR
jgi:hypothetical protein